MKAVVVLSLMVLSSVAQASMYDNNTTLVEIAHAMAQCPGQVGSLGRFGKVKEQEVREVKSEQIRPSDSLSIKTYTIVSKVGGRYGGPAAETTATLTITATATHENHTGPSEVEWKCEVSN